MLSSLRGCAGWSAPLFFTSNKVRDLASRPILCLSPGFLVFAWLRAWSKWVKCSLTDSRQVNQVFFVLHDEILADFVKLTGSGLDNDVNVPLYNIGF